MQQLIITPLTLIKQNPGLAYAMSGFIAVAIVELSLTPLSQLPPVPGGDKSHHLIAYSVLGFPTALSQPRKLLFLGLVYVGLGGLIELLQPYVNRYGEFTDFAANAAGVFIGSLLGVWISKRI